MQAADVFDDGRTGTKEQMKCIAEHDLRPGSGELIGQEPFHRPLRPDHHERGRFEQTMARRHSTYARGRRWIIRKSFKRQRRA